MEFSPAQLTPSSAMTWREVERDLMSTNDLKKKFQCKRELSAQEILKTQNFRRSERFWCEHIDVIPPLVHGS